MHAAMFRQSSILATLAAESSIPRHASRLSQEQRRTRMLLAAGAHGDESGWWALLGLLVMFGGLGIYASTHDPGAVVALVALAVPFGVVPIFVLALHNNRKRDAAIAALLRELPYDGIADWIVADRPLVELELHDRIDARLLEQALRTVENGHAIEVEAVSDRVVRIAIPPRASLEHHGDLPLLRAVIAQVITPLGTENPIVRFSLGGIVDSASN